MSELDTLLTAWQAWHDAPDDEDAAAAYRSAAAVARSGPALRPGEIVADRYRITDHVNDGPLAATWAASDLVSGDPVRVQTLHARFLHDATLVERFHTAIARQGEVAERGIVSIHATGEPWCGFHWAVTGSSREGLPHVVDDLDEHDARQLLLDVARALEHAHAAGLAHGRVAPEAVVIDERGAASLADFGLQPPGQADGAFAAPELADPAHEASPAADRYSFAMLAAYVLASGQLPYWAARDPERFVRSVDADEALVEGLVASVHWDPAERPEGVGDLVRALRADTDHVRVLVERAREGGRPDAALEHLRHLLAVGGGDPDIRVELAQALAAAGRDRQAIDQLYAALRASRLRGVEVALTELRRLVERTGETGPLIDALERRAHEPGAHRDVFLLEVARLRARAGEGDVPDAWKAALDAHTRSDQAQVALWALCELAAQANDWATFVTRGAELATYLDDPAPIARRIGHAYHDHLGDPHAALGWLERAREAGDADPALEKLVEALRAQRGDWPEVLELLEERAEHTGQPDQTLLRAARLARRAARQPERATALYARLAEFDAHIGESAHWLAERAAQQEQADEELRWLLKAVGSDTARPHLRLRAAELLRENGDGEAADEQVAAVLAAVPDHIDATAFVAIRRRDEADAAGATEAIASLVDRHGPTTDHGATFWLLHAELLWRAGHRRTSYELAEQVLRFHPQRAEAHWALSRAALGGPLGDDDGGLHDAPGRLGPPEALARLLAECLHHDALQRWCDQDPLGLPAPRSPLELAAAVVDGLMASGQVHALFDELEALDGVDNDAVATVRRLWDGMAEALPIERILRWGGGRPSSTREVLAQRPRTSPWCGSPRSLDDLLEPASITMTDAEEPPGNQGPPLLEPAATLVVVAYPGDARQQQVVLEGDRLTIGGGEDDDLSVVGLPAAHATVHRHGAEVYIAAAEGLRVGPRASTERRLEAGLDLDLSGVPLRVRLRSDILPVPTLTPLPSIDELEDEQTMVVEREWSPRPTALFFEDAGAEYMLPLVEIMTEIDGGHLIAEDDGWRLVPSDGPEQFVVDGDRFAVGGTRYNVRRIESITPVPVPRAEEPSEGVPTLFVDEGTAMARVVALRERTTIGRGREMDLKLRSDAKVSRHHATIEVRPDREVVLVDAGSSNGTYVDGAEVVDEMILRPGQSVLVGDTRLEFRLGVATAAKANLDAPPSDDLKATRLSPRPRNTVPRPSLAEGRHRMAVVNRGLAPLLGAVDAAQGPGAGAAELQLLMESAGRFATLFESVEAKHSGLPVLPVLFNQARAPGTEQRRLLTAGLLDLLERASQHLPTLMHEDDVDDVLEQVARSDYRKHLRM